MNINGLLNAHDETDVIAHECESVNAESIRDVYQSALNRHPEASVYIISDNIEKYKEELEVLLTLKFRLCNSQTISF